jgi:hypothetical protein
MSFGMNLLSFCRSSAFEQNSNVSRKSPMTGEAHFGR